MRNANSPKFRHSSVAAFPFAFHLHHDDPRLRSRQDDETLFVLDGPQHLELQICNTASTPLRLVPIAEPASRDHHHFALTFRPGTLLDPAAIRVADGDWELTWEREVDGAGLDQLYLRHRAHRRADT